MGKAPAGSFWKTVGAFVVVGPFVGGLVLGLIGLNSGFGGLASGPMRIENFAAVLLWGLVAYPFGFIPAALTGLVGGIISTKVSSKIAWVAVCTLAGAVIAAAIMAIMFGGADVFVFYGSIGAVAALASSLVGLQVRPRWSD